MSLRIFLRRSSRGLSTACGTGGSPFSPTWTTLPYGTGIATHYWPRSSRLWSFCRIWVSASTSRSPTRIPLRRRFGWASTGCLRRATGIFLSRVKRRSVAQLWPSCGPLWSPADRSSDWWESSTSRARSTGSCGPSFSRSRKEARSPEQPNATPQKDKIAFLTSSSVATVGTTDSSGG